MIMQCIHMKCIYFCSNKLTTARLAVGSFKFFFNVKCDFKTAKCIVLYGAALMSIARLDAPEYF